MYLELISIAFYTNSWVFSVLSRFSVIVL